MDAVSQSNRVDIHVGSRIALARIEAELSLDALADKLEINADELARIEKGAVRPSAGLLFDIGELLGKPLDYFFADLRSREN
jgi:transcriptional regulator with XRE-family HTH domain